MRSLLLAPVLAAALVTPAAAATPSYDIDIAAKLSGTASGSDGDGWTSASTFRATVGQSYRGLPGRTDQHGDETVLAEATTPPQVNLTALDQQYSLETAGGTLTWSCTADGQAKGAPGSLRLTRLDEKGSISASLLDEKVTQGRDCGGFSTFADSIDISREPVTVPPTEFNWADLVKGPVRIPIDRFVLCGEWTIYQTACQLRLTGEMVIRRSLVEDAEPEPDEAPEPEPTGYQPAETGDEPTSPPRPATRIGVKGSPWRGGKGAKVKVTCAKACQGKVSVKAVAKGGKAAKAIGSEAFKSRGGTKSVTVIYGKGGSRTASRRGAVIITVKASGQTSSSRMRTR